MQWLVMVGVLNAAAQAGEVRIWPTATADGDRVRIADVADVRGFDAAETERIAAVIVAASPKTGAAARLTLDDIRRALDEAHVNLARVTLRGSADCVVSVRAAVTHVPAAPKPRPAASHSRPAAARDVQNRPGTLASVQLISTQPEPRPANNRKSEIDHRKSAPPMAAAPVSDHPVDLESLLRAYFDDSVKSMGGRAEVRFGAAQRAALALRGPECRFAIHPRGDARLGMVWLDIEVQRDGQKPQIIPIMAEVTLLRPVVVATRVLNHGQEVTARDVRMESRPFKRVEDVGITDLASVVGMEARRAIHPGDMVASRDIRTKPLVQRNQIVAVWSREGGLVVQMAGRATQEAWLGDVIEIRAEGSQAKFFATVSGPGTVTATSGTEVASK